jgi:hypothetical protein
LKDAASKERPLFTGLNESSASGHHRSRHAEDRVTTIVEEMSTSGDCFLLAQFRNGFQKIRLRLFQLSNEPPMAVAINRFSCF